MWRPDSPVELPNGRWVCKLHGLGVCGICCVDYDHIDEMLEPESLTGVELHQDPRPQPALSMTMPPGQAREMLRGTGEAFATKFSPPSSTDMPSSLFPGAFSSRARTPFRKRFVNLTNPGQILIYTDGACLSNGLPGPRAGWGFVYGPTTDRGLCTVSGRLEDKGPFGNEGLQTSNRAELRAVTAALRFREWDGEGFDSVVIATDSEYVVEGATTWTKKWTMNGWKTRELASVKNQDLWQALLGDIEHMKHRGLDVQFWRIPRTQNTWADEEAKKGASMPPVAEFHDIHGVAC